jgi:molybdenum cofactor cytidylyltransferase
MTRTGPSRESSAAMGKHPRARIAAVLLAAGAASRFGTAKQLALIDEETTLVERALETLKRSQVDSIVVVLGNKSDEAKERLGRLGERVRVALNPQFRSGLSSSLKVGVKEVADESDALVVALADQPLVNTKLIDDLIRRYRTTGNSIVTASSGDLVTPPALFDKSLYAHLLALKGDVGARAVILSHPGFERVEVERDVLLDVDTEQDIKKAREKVSLLSRSPGREIRRAQARGGHARARPSSD